MGVTSRKLVSPGLRGGQNIDGVWARVCGTGPRLCARACVGAARSGRISQLSSERLLRVNREDSTQ